MRLDSILERRYGKQFTYFLFTFDLRRYMSVAAMIVHRYARITPAFAAVLVFYSEIASRIGDGPFFIRFQQSVFR
jgi:hypothetical protein